VVFAIAARPGRTAAMGQGSPDLRALETAERVLAGLRLLAEDESDHAIRSLIDAIEDDRARLLAWMIGWHVSPKPPPRSRALA
jgi:hypothetical protein